jgi:Ca-activated chloride channel family protein
MALNAIHHSQSGNKRKALLIISDGGENHSRYTWKEIKRAAIESDAQVYVIGVFEPLAARDRTSEEITGPSNLADIVNASGGAFFAIEDTFHTRGELKDELSDIALKISQIIRSEYVITYRPSNFLPDGKWRRIKVHLHPPRGLPPLQIHFRTGYYAPSY